MISISQQLFWNGYVDPDLILRVSPYQLEVTAFVELLHLQCYAFRNFYVEVVSGIALAAHHQGSHHHEQIYLIPSVQMVSSIPKHDWTIQQRIYMSAWKVKNSPMHRIDNSTDTLSSHFSFSRGKFSRSYLISRQV